MPYYDYRCELCTEIFEASHPMEGPSPGTVVKCPVCGTGRVRRIFISVPAMKIWYRNAAASSDAESMRPRFYQSVTRKKTVASETAADFGGR